MIASKQGELLYDPVEVNRQVDLHPSVALYLKYLAAVNTQLKLQKETRRKALKVAKECETKIFQLMDRRGRQCGALSVVRQHIYNQLVSQHIHAARQRILNAD